jgi:hypothetical protein
MLSGGREHVAHNSVSGSFAEAAALMRPWIAREPASSRDREVEKPEANGTRCR